jgi:hypothetical protein
VVQHETLRYGVWNMLVKIRIAINTSTAIHVRISRKQICVDTKDASEPYRAWSYRPRAWQWTARLGCLAYKALSEKKRTQESAKIFISVPDVFLSDP